MTIPCQICRHRGPIVAGRTTCRAAITEALVGWLERVGEALDGEAREVEQCPDYGREVRG